MMILKIDPNEVRWFAMSSPYCREMKAKELLDSHGIKNFIPMVRKQVMVNKELVEQILIQSLKRLYEIDEPNIKYEVSERNVCARLAHHMENVMREYDQQNNSYYFQNYYVDIEYNRMGFGDLKHFEAYRHESKYMVSDLLFTPEVMKVIFWQ